MESEKKEDILVVGGYRFATVADAETARMEIKKVENLEQRLDYRNPKNVLLVYNRAIDNKVFLTPIGINYLLKMQRDLKRWGVPEDMIRPVPLYVTFSNKTEKNKSIRESVAKRQPVYQGRFVTSVLINIVLALLVAAMVAIAWDSDRPNIINYRRAVVNEYSEWEQELTEREQKLREAQRRSDAEQTQEQ